MCRPGGRRPRRGNGRATSPPARFPPVETPFRPPHLTPAAQSRLKVAVGYIQIVYLWIAEMFSWLCLFWRSFEVVGFGEVSPGQAGAWRQRLVLNPFGGCAPPNSSGERLPTVPASLLEAAKHMAGNCKRLLNGHQSIFGTFMPLAFRRLAKPNEVEILAVLKSKFGEPTVSPIGGA